MDQDLVNELKRLRDERQKKFDEEDWEGALAIHDKILELSPSALRYANRASILFRLGRLQDAIDSYRTALQMDPSLKRARADLERLEAQLQQQTGKTATSAMPSVSMSDEEKQRKINELRNIREQRLAVQDWSGALYYHNQILEIEPNALRYANHGSILYRMGKLPEAVASYKKALELDHTLERARLDLEKIQSQMEEEKILGVSQEKQMENDDQDIQAQIEELRKKRQAKIEQEDWPAALTIHDELLKLDPSPLRYANRASLLYRLNRLSEALQSYKKALEMDPSLEKAKEEMERLKAEMEEASLLASPSATETPATSALAAAKAKMSPAEIAAKITELRDERQRYLDAKEWEKALALHDQIIDLEPTPLRYVNRGSMLYRMGRLEKAIEDYRHALSMDQNLGRAKQDLVRMEEELKAKGGTIPEKEPPKQAAARTMELPARPEPKPEKKISAEELAKKMEELRQKRQILMDQSKWEEALVVQDEILALEPNALRYANRGSILFRLGRTKDAIFSYRKALDMDSSLERAQEDLDKIKDTEMEKLRNQRQEKMDKEEWQAALDTHDIILALEPTALRYANRGSILYRMGRIADAVETYRKALSMDPNLEQAKQDLTELEKQVQKAPLMAIPVELAEDDETLPVDALPVELETPAVAVDEIQVAPKATSKAAACLASLSGHTKEITHLALTPDQSSLISASKDNTLRVWNLQNNKLVNTLQGHTDWIRAFCLNNKGDKILSGSDDWTIRFWDIASGKCEYTLNGHSMPIGTVAISKNDHFGFSGSRDKSIRIWDLKIGKPITTLEGHQDWVNTIRLMPEGDKAISGSYDGTVRIWNVLGWRCTNTLQGHQGWVEKLLLTPDGRTIISSGTDRAIKIWEMPSCKTPNTLEGHKEPILDMQLSLDGKLLLSAGMDGTIHLWEIPSGSLKASFSGIACRFEKVAITPDNRHVLAAGSDSKIWIWEIETGKIVGTWDDHPQPVSAFLFSVKNHLLISAGRDGIIKVWDYALIGK